VEYAQVIIEAEEKFSHKYNHGLPPILKENHDYVSTIAKVILFEGMLKKNLNIDDAFKILYSINEKSNLKEYIFLFESSRVDKSLQSKSLSKMYDLYITERKVEDSPLTALAKVGIKLENRTLTERFMESKKDLISEGEENMSFIDKEESAEDQFNLAVNYEFGQLGSVQDISKAVSYYTKAAERGLAKAQHNLALVYEHGKGVSADQQKAIDWYTKAAEQGLPDSQMNLAEYYSRDNIGNFKEAIKWYEKCKDTEFKGKFQLGLLVHRGTGIDQDKSRGLRLLREAADEGDHDTKIDLADYLSYLMSDQDTTMTNEDFSDEIDQLTNDVIENGSDEFLHLTGVDYAMSGDWHKARPLIEKASSRFYPDAMVALASMYMNGYGGLEQDFNEAKRLLAEAVDLGSEHAKTMLDAIDYRP
jgi:TPR repeat protein